jgi:hypothetical protein
MLISNAPSGLPGIKINHLRDWFKRFFSILKFAVSDNYLPFIKGTY